MTQEAGKSKEEILSEWLATDLPKQAATLNAMEEYAQSIEQPGTPEPQWPTAEEIEREALLLYPTVDEEKNPNVNRIIGFERAAFKACAQWLQTSAGTREAELREALEEITSLNPYPESVFQPISNGELKAVGGMLKNINGMSLDRLSGHIGRLLLKGIQTRAKSLLNKTDL